MKNTKLSRILVLAISLVILVGAAVGFSASAEDTTEYTYEIVSMNIAYGDQIQVLVALDAPLDNQDDIIVKYNHPTEGELTATYWKTMDVNGTDRPVWYTKGISAKDLGQDVVATVYYKEQAVDTANTSVASYIYEMLYKNGYINATTDADLHKKALYQNLLNYAASAETVLWNDKEENANDQRVLITDKLYVYAVDGTVDADKQLTSDVLTADETVTLSYTGTAPEGKKFSGVWLSSVDGTSVIKDGVATNPTVHGVYEPVFTAETHTTGKYYASTTEGTRYDFDTALNLDVAGGNSTDLSVYDAENNPTGILASALDSDATDSLITNQTSTLNNSTGALVFEMNTGTYTGFTIAKKEDTVGSAGSKYIAEFDFTYISSKANSSYGSNTIPFYIGPTFKNENNANMHTITHATFAADREVMMFGSVPVVKGSTYTIRIESTVGGGYALYVDDVLAASEATYNTANADRDANLYAGFGFMIRGKNAGDSFSFSIDNLYMGTIDSYYEDKTIDGIRLDFSDESDLDSLTYNYSTSINTPTASITDGVMYCNPTANWNGFAVESGDTNTYSSGIYVFEADINYIEATTQHTDGTNVFMGFQIADYDGISNDKCFDMGRITVDSTKTKYNIMNNLSSFTENEHVLEIGTTYKMRFEYDTTTGVTSIYIDGVLVDQNVADNGAAVNENSINGVKTDKGNANNTFGDFIFIWRRYGKISVDNIYYGVINGVVAE